MHKYNFAVSGGTFDLLHVGHKEFLKEIINSSKKVLLGITSDEYINKNKNNLNIEKFSIRKKNVNNFLVSINARAKVKIVKINSAYDPYLEKDRRYDVIFVTANTKETAFKINKKRFEYKTPPLIIKVLEMKLSQDGKEISSTRIRNGEINRNGMVYSNLDWKNKDLTLPNKLRVVLKTPWGKVLKNIPKNLNGEKTVVVGDAVSKQFNKHEVGQFLSVIDFLINREKRFKNISEVGFKNKNVLKIKNPPGVITFKLFQAIKKIFKRKLSQTVILIDGEDDLSVLPIILLSPLGFNIFYGQPGVGMVWIRVDETVKERAYKLITGFKSV